LLARAAQELCQLTGDVANVALGVGHQHELCLCCAWSIYLFLEQ
jgi:hypothetical protein